MSRGIHLRMRSLSISILEQTIHISRWGNAIIVFISHSLFDKISRFVLSAARGKEQRAFRYIFSGALLHAPGSAFSANTMQHNEGVIVIVLALSAALLLFSCRDLLQLVRFKGSIYFCCAPF